MPNFKPSKPVEEAASLGEALSICASYQVQAPQNKSGKAMPTRVSTLVPWVRCFEKILVKFPESKFNKDFVVFYRELNGKVVSTNPPDAEIVDGPAFNIVVNKIVDHLKAGQRLYAPQDIQAIGHVLPGFALYLTDRSPLSGALEPKIQDQEIAKMKNETTPSIFGSKLQKSNLDPAQKSYCSKYRDYRALVYDLEDLERYRNRVSSQSYETTNTREHEMRNQIQRRFESLKKEALSERIALSRKLQDLQKKTPWFDNGVCLHASANP